MTDIQESYDRCSIDWSQFGCVHAGVSGGKDSTAALLWLVHDSGCPKEKIVASFCDTANEDPLTYAYIAMLNERVHPITTVNTIGFFGLARKKKRFPGRKSRFCTSELKIIPSIRRVIELTKEHGDVLCVSGMRREEGHGSNNRATLPFLAYSGDYFAMQLRPLIDWPVQAVADLIRKYIEPRWVQRIVHDDARLKPMHKLKLAAAVGNGTPWNPLYYMGSSRVGCFPCIFSAKAEIRAMAKYRPERVDQIEVEEKSVVVKNPNMMATFFSHNTVPPRFRSVPVICKDGRRMKAATIRDVVRWSKTARGAKNLALDLDGDELPPCVIGGHCE